MWHPTKYEYDGAIFRCPGKCGVFDPVLSRFVTPVKVMAGKAEVSAEKKA
jgi:hypothetical protein